MTVPPSVGRIKGLIPYGILAKHRLYRGDIDSPKTTLSGRRVAFPQNLAYEIEAWKEMSLDTGADAWVFPSEKAEKPIRKDNLWWRNIRPRLQAVNLDWVNFQVMRRTHASLMNELEVDPKVVAEQLGHSLDVNLNVYTKVAQKRRKQWHAFLALEMAVFSRSEIRVPPNGAQMGHT
jgi:integrase